MKKLIWLICLALPLAACKKSNVKPPRHDLGVITGYDLNECFTVPCGGLSITLSSDPTPSARQFYHINTTLTKLGISESTKFPIHVSLDWKPDTGIYGRANYIVVTQVKVIK